MAGRTPDESTRNFIDPLQELISFVTDAVLVTTGYYLRLEPHALTLSPRDATRLCASLPVKVISDSGSRCISAMRRRRAALAHGG